MFVSKVEPDDDEMRRQRALRLRALNLEPPGRCGSPGGSAGVSPRAFHGGEPPMDDFMENPDLFSPVFFSCLAHVLSSNLISTCTLAAPQRLCNHSGIRQSDQSGTHLVRGRGHPFNRLREQYKLAWMKIAQILVGDAGTRWAPKATCRRRLKADPRQLLGTECGEPGKASDKTKSR